MTDAVVVITNPSVTVTVGAPTSNQFTLSDATIADIANNRPQTVVGSPPPAISAPSIVQPVIIGEGFGVQGPPGPPGPGASFTTAGTTIPVGGIPAGSVFADASVQTVLTDMLCPYQHPAFTSFGISGIGSPLEVGASFGPSVTFAWSTSQSGNVAASTISISDATLMTSIATSQPNTGSYAATLAGAITRTSAGTHAFNIGGTDTESVTFVGSVTFTWQWTRYIGTNASPTLTAAQILALASSSLATGYAGTFSLAAGGYKFICLADALAGGLNSVRDAATGFSVPMATGAQTDSQGFGYQLVSVTNAHGVTTPVRVYRTLNVLGGSITLIVT